MALSSEFAMPNGTQVCLQLHVSEGSKTHSCLDENFKTKGGKI